MPRTVLLWAEHCTLLAIAGFTVYDVYRSRRENKKPFQLLSQALDSLVGFLVPPAAGSPSVKPVAALGPASSGALVQASNALASNAQAIKELAGPKEVLTWPGVSEAPGASMDMANVAEGEATAYRDGRGAIYKFKLGEGVFVNMYFTRAGYRRSGDLHDCNQYDVVLRGRTRLRMIDPHTGSEVVKEYGANDFIVIPARTPHMFEFLEDNYLLEWWDDDFKAWYYKPYRSVIEAGLALAETEGRDFSISKP